MDTIVMNVDECDIAHEALMLEEYGEEVMFAGWNPQLNLLGDSPVTPINKHVNLFADLANMDIDSFREKLYEYLC